jgi:hypothetical protein
VDDVLDGMMTLAGRYLPSCMPVVTLCLVRTPSASHDGLTNLQGSLQRLTAILHFILDGLFARKLLLVSYHLVVNFHLTLMLSRYIVLQGF